MEEIALLKKRISIALNELLNGKTETKFEKEAGRVKKFNNLKDAIC